MAGDNVEPLALDATQGNVNNETEAAYMSDNVSVDDEDVHGIEVDDVELDAQNDAADSPKPTSSLGSMEGSGTSLSMDISDMSAHMADVVVAAQQKQLDDGEKPFTTEYYAARSLYLFPLENPFRRLMIRVSESTRFDQLIIFFILANCIFLALFDPLDKDPNSELNRTLDISEQIFAVVFLIEAVIKIIAFGFVMDKKSYLRDHWNKLDFVIVVTGMFVFTSLEGNYTALRTLRVLRPLRTITHVQGMKVLVNSLLGSLPMLADVLILCALLFFVFGILAIQLFSGKLLYRCQDVNTGAWIDEDRTCNPNPNEEGYKCGGDPAQRCAYYGSNPNFGITNFDNIGFSFLTIFQCITLEGWTDVMYLTMDATSDFAFLYFVLLIIIGSFFVINLALAVVNSTFSDLQKTRREEDAKAADSSAAQEQDESFIGKAFANIAWYFRPPDKDHTFWLKEKAPVLVQRTRALVDSRFFQTFIIASILLNTLTMAMQYYGQPKAYGEALEGVNLFFTIVFMFEMAIKLVAMGPHEYVSDSFNLFDGTLVIISIIELGVSGGQGAGGLGVLRTFRLLRVFKLVRSWEGLNKLLNTIAKSLGALGNFTFLLLLFMFIYAILGMQLYGGTFVFEGQEPSRANFDSLLWSFVTIFQVLTGEDWQTIMWDGIRATDLSAVIYFVSLFVLGNYMIFNLFLAIILDEFAEQQRIEAEEKKRLRELNPPARKKKRSLVNKLRSKGSSASKTAQPQSLEMTRIGEADTPVTSTLDQPEASSDPSADNDDEVDDNDNDDASDSADVDASPSASPSASPLPAHMRAERDSARYSRSSSTASDASGKPSNHLGNLSRSSTSSSLRSAADDSVAASSANDLLRYPPPSGKAFLVIPSDSVVREYAYRIVKHKYFEWLIFLFIFISSINLAIENPAFDPASPVMQALRVMDIIFIIAFVIEMLLKMIAFGFVLGENSYLRDNWNKLDFFIVIISIVSFFVSSGELKAFRALRALRALRPLRLVARSQGMKVVVNALILSVPKITNAVAVSLLFWLIFAILGVEVFGGRFYSCNDDSVMNRAQCTGTFGADNTTRVWSNPPYSFDSTPVAMLTLFEISTLEGWLEVMYSGVDAVGVDQQPQKDHQVGFVFFFIAFIIVGSFFIVNIFVGVVIDTFNRIKGEIDGNLLLTPSQAEWLSAQKQACRMKPIKFKKPPRDKWRQPFFHFQNHIYFEYFIMGCIVVNVIVMACEHYPMTKQFQQSLNDANLVFSCVFIVEAVIKLIGLYPKRYFSDGWNRFDFFIVVTSIIDMAVDVGVGASLLRVIRMSRVTRIFKLVRSLQGLQTLLKTLYFSLPSLWNVGSLLFLLFFIFAVLGVNLFAGIKHGDALNDHANFDTFGTSMLTLFRVSTGEAWNSLMVDMRVQPPDCDPAANNCGSELAPAYFIVFIIVVSFVMLNLFIAVILERFDDTQDAENRIIKDDDLENFRENWAKFDPKATEYIDCTVLPHFLRALGPPLGVPKNASEKTCLRVVANLQIPVNMQNKVTFVEVLQAMMARAYPSMDIASISDLSSVKEVITLFQKMDNREEKQAFDAATIHAVAMLQKAWRKRKAMRSGSASQNEDKVPIMTDNGVVMMTLQEAEEYKMSRRRSIMPRRMSVRRDNSGAGTGAGTGAAK